MKDDNTPTITARSRNPTSHMRLRVENAKKLEKLGARAKAKRVESKQEASRGGQPGKIDPIFTRAPRLKKNTLNQPPKPSSKFRKRQVHKSWLPTHLYHAKRAHMTPPQEPLWRFAIPMTPTEKSYRATYRAGQMRGCVAWDMSYICTIGIVGFEGSLLGLMRGLGVPQNMLTTKKGEKWRRGTRFWDGWVRERDGEQRPIARVEIIWCAECEKNQVAVSEIAVDTSSKKKQKRKAFLRVHPSAFLQLWTEVLKVAKIQRPAVLVEDSRFEIGSIEIIGPGSTEALVGILHPGGADMDPLPPVDVPMKLWPSLSSVTNPASLPANALLGFEISDPRLNHPPRTVNSSTDSNELLRLLSSWPPDTTQMAPLLFDRSARLTASRLLPSQKSINRRKGAALAGAYPSALPTDPRIPILILASRPENSRGGQGSWTVLLPWKCVLPVWYSLMHYPLASGGNPRFGGLQEKRQILFEQCIPWFPADHSGTEAGWQWELNEREKRKMEWEKRPKGKRTEWESIDLGAGRKGEIGRGWACDWERLFEGPKAASTVESTAQADDTSEIVKPPLKLYHSTVPHSTYVSQPTSPTALTTISITCLHRGVPTTCARIYQLPTRNPSLRAKWLELASSPSKNSRKSHPRSIPTRPAVDAPTHEKRAALATSLLTPPAAELNHTASVSQTADSSYPLVPDEEDLIGFVTTGNFNLAEGRGKGIGCVAVARVTESLEAGRHGGLCIIRESGQEIGRLARWELV